MLLRREDGRNWHASGDYACCPRHGHLIRIHRCRFLDDGPRHFVAGAGHWRFIRDPECWGVSPLYHLMRKWHGGSGEFVSEWAEPKLVRDRLRERPSGKMEREIHPVKTAANPINNETSRLVELAGLVTELAMPWTRIHITALSKKPPGAGTP